MKEINKLEDIKNKNPYEDIINLPHPTSKRHPRQPMEARAAQFSPFAALTGFSDEIKETERITRKEITLTEESLERLDQILNELEPSKKATIKVTYFLKDQKKTGGTYQEITGTLKKIDTYKKIIEIQDKIQIPIKDIVNIERIDLSNNENLL